MVKNLYGANEAVALNDASTAVEPNITFGKGAFDESTVVAITEKDDSDSKIRFVYGGEGGSGLIFAGNKLVSSKILDITTNEAADKVTVTWFGTQVDKADDTVKTQVWTTEFNIVDKDTVAAMIEAAQEDLQDQLDAIEEQHAEDVSALNAKESSKSI